MSFITKPLNFLIIEDNEGDFILFESYLKQTGLDIKNVYHSSTLSHAGIYHRHTDIAFLDLSLPDSNGVESFINLNKQMPHVPIVVLSGMADEEIALQCISMGAQDYLLKNELNESLLEKSICYSIERKKNLEALRNINRQYEMIGNITHDLIWNWNLETNEISVGRKTFFDYNSDDLGATLGWWFDKAHPEDRDRIAEAINKIVTGKAQQLQEEYRFRTAEGTYRIVLTRGVLLPGKDGLPDQVIGSMIDLTETRQLQNALVSTQLKFQKQLTEATILGQEKEKEHIGKELHDNINQILASVKLYLEIAINNPDMRNQVLASCKKNTEDAIHEIRKLSHSLIPPSLGDHGLIDAISELVEEVNEFGTFKTELLVINFDEDALDNNRKLMLYRIVQEQVNNITKYSKASEVVIELHTEGPALVLTISDNGVGFDSSKKAKGIGLRNIENRVAYYAGEAVIHSETGKGTTLRVELPIN